MILNKILELNKASIKVEFFHREFKTTVIRLTDILSADLRSEEYQATFDAMHSEYGIYTILCSLEDKLRPKYIKPTFGEKLILWLKGENK